MRRRMIMQGVQDDTIDVKNADIGDVYLYDKETGTCIFVKKEVFQEYDDAGYVFNRDFKYSSERYSPIGIVIIPYYHCNNDHFKYFYSGETYMPLCEIISLVSMNYQTPKIGATDNDVDMYAGDILTYRGYALNTIYCGYSAELDSNWVQNPYAYAPTLRVAGNESAYDNYEKCYYCASPYDNDLQINTKYFYNTDILNTNGDKNAQADVFGEYYLKLFLNSDAFKNIKDSLISDEDTSIPLAMACCSKFSPSGISGWYLPAIGELIHLCINFTTIMKIAKSLESLYGITTDLTSYSDANDNYTIFFSSTGVLNHTYTLCPGTTYITTTGTTPNSVSGDHSMFRYNAFKRIY